MSTCTIGFGLFDFWVGEHDPTVNEIPEIGIISVNNQYMNTISKELFQCLDATPGAQVWLRRITTRVLSTPTFQQATTALKLSATRFASVRYNFLVNFTTLLGTQGVVATLKYADDAQMQSNAVIVFSDSISVGGILNLNVSKGIQLFGTIPPDKFRQVTFTSSGGAAAPASMIAGQEELI